MSLPTTLLLQIIGTKLDELDALRTQLSTELGADPALNLRLEIQVADERYTVSVQDSDIMVRDEIRGRVLASGDREIATFALKGLEATDVTPPAPA